MLQSNDLSKNLLALQQESQRVIAILAGIASYLWLTFLFWPVTGGNAPFTAWVGAVVLATSATMGLVSDEKRLRNARQILVWGVLFGVTAAYVASPLPALPYLFIIPVIFGSVLLPRWFVLVGTVVACVIIAVVGLSRLESARAVVDLFLPMATVSLVALGSWLSARNIYIALTWFARAYNQALENERLARNYQGELRRVLKTLDESNQRIQRTNYMLSIARNQADEANKLKQQFVQTISHELRTPLNLIVGFSELMIKSPEYYGGQLASSYLRDLSIVFRNACHLQGLVNDVLDLSRIEASQLSLHLQLVEPSELAYEAADMMRSLIEAQNLRLIINIAEDLPCVWMDQNRIRQVLVNLLNNAARFTERGTVTVTTHRGNGEILFAVTDTGVGICKEELPLIFEEFHQVDGSTRRQHEGAGLGLAISRQLVRLHGGQIWVESIVGHGSTFTFSLPIVPKDDSVAALSQSGRGGQVAMSPQQRPVMLAVTRSPAAATLLTGHLHHCRTLVAQNLEQAASMARRLLPQGIVIDTTGEQLSPDTLQTAVQEWALPETPVIACPLPGEEFLRQSLAVDGYLVKPIQMQNLLDVLRQLGADIESILMIDDDRDFVRLLRGMLHSTARHYQIYTAHGGREGLAMLEQRQPDLLLLDLVMPDMTGFQVIEAVRGDHRYHNTKIVVVSAQDEIDTIRTLPGSMWVTKSEGIKLSELVKWIQQVMNTSINASTESTKSIS